MKKLSLVLVALLFSSWALAAPATRSIMGTGTPMTKTLTVDDDAAHDLDDLWAGATAVGVYVGSEEAWAVWITVEGGPIRYAFGVAPTQGGVGHVMEAGDPPLRIPSAAMLRAMKLINETNGLAATIQATAEVGN